MLMVWDDSEGKRHSRVIFIFQKFNHPAKGDACCLSRTPCTDTRCHATGRKKIHREKSDVTKSKRRGKAAFAGDKIKSWTPVNDTAVKGLSAVTYSAQIPRGTYQ